MEIKKHIQIARGENLAIPTLFPGELGFTTDEKALYVGTESSENIRFANDSELDNKINTHTHSPATPETSGFMSNSDKSKLDGIATGATRNVISSGTGSPSGGNSGDLYFRYS